MKKIASFIVAVAAACASTPLSTWAGPVVEAPIINVGGTPLTVSPVVLPEGFTQPHVLRYALWTVHETGRRMDVLGNRYPELSGDKMLLAVKASSELEGALKEVLKRHESSSFGTPYRAASTADAMAKVRTAYSAWEAAVSVPEVKSLLTTPSAEAAQERAKASVRQLKRLIEKEQAGWPNSRPAEIVPVRSAPEVKGSPTARGAKEAEPLKTPETMETVFKHLPGALADTARAEYKRAYDEAYYDGVTGIHSRKYLDDHATVFSAEDSHQLVGDVDHFKKVNDEWGGHAIGDQTLKEVAQIWGQELEKAGEVGVRWGGEEFWGRVRGGEAKAVAVAKAINERVRKEVHLKIGLPKPLTISIGISGTRKESLDRREDFDNTFKKADLAVFEAKHRGRDRVVLHGADAMQVWKGDPKTPDRHDSSRSGRTGAAGVLAAALSVIFRRRK